MNDPIQEALASLRARRQATFDELERLDVAIASLEQLLPAPAPFTVVPTEHVKRSVKQMMIDLLDETNHDWGVNEILREYEQRGTPIQAKDPSNALRAAIAEANKAGWIYRTAPGRYKAARWKPGQEDAVSQAVRVGQPIAFGIAGQDRWPVPARSRATEGGAFG